MKILLAVTTLVAVVAAEVPAPYPARGWRPSGPAFELPQKSAQEYLPPADPRRLPKDLDDDVSVQGLPVQEPVPHFQVSPISGQQYVGPTFNADIRNLDERYRQIQIQQQRLAEQQQEQARLQQEYNRQQQQYNTPQYNFQNQQTSRIPTSTTTARPDFRTTTLVTTTESLNEGEVPPEDDENTSSGNKVTVEITKQNVQEYPATAEILLTPLTQFKIQSQSNQKFGQIKSPVLVQVNGFEKQTPSPGFDGPVHLAALQSILSQRQFARQNVVVQNQQGLSSPAPIAAVNQQTNAGGFIILPQGFSQQNQYQTPDQGTQFRIEPVLLQPQPAQNPDAESINDDEDNNNQEQQNYQPQGVVVQSPSYQPQGVLNYQPQSVLVQPQAASAQPQTYQPQPQAQGFQPQGVWNYQPQVAPVQSQEALTQTQTYQPQPQTQGFQPQGVWNYQPQVAPVQSQEALTQTQTYQPQTQTQGFQPQGVVNYQPQVIPVQPQEILTQPQSYEPQPQTQGFQPQRVLVQQQPQEYQPQQQQNYQPNPQIYQPQQLQPVDLQQNQFLQPQVVDQQLDLSRYYQNQQQLIQQQLLLQQQILQQQQVAYQGQGPYQGQVPYQGQGLQSGFDVNQQGNSVDDEDDKKGNNDEESQGGSATATATAFGDRTRPRVNTQYGAPVLQVTTTERTLQNEESPTEGPATAEATAVARGERRKNAKLRNRRVRPVFTLDKSGHLVLAQEQ